MIGKNERITLLLVNLMACIVIVVVVVVVCCFLFTYCFLRVSMPRLVP